MGEPGVGAFLRHHCRVGDCDAPAVDGDSLCQTHTKRKHRGRPLSAPVAHKRASAWDTLVEAALAYADCTDEVHADRAAFTRIRARLSMAARRYVLGSERCP